MNLSPKQIYEKIVLQNYTPTEEESSALEGTVWKHKLDGTTPPLKKPVFKSFFEEDSPPVDEMSRFALCAYIADKIEDRYDLHFSSPGALSFDPKRFPQVKEYALSLLHYVNATIEAKNSVIQMVHDSKSINSLMVKLSLGAS